MENRAITLYAASLAALGILLLAGPFALRPTDAVGGESSLPLLLALLGGALLLGQAVVVYRGILRAAASRHLETEELRCRLAELSGRDELTGAFSRTMLESVLARELESVRRYGVVTSCIMLDVDGLGRVNREHGFRAGDQALRALGEALAANLRATDSLFRWQGGRFMVLVPHVRVDLAAHLAEKLRRLVERFAFADGLRITISLSVAEVAASDTQESLVERLRAGLEKAKAAGPNRLEVLRSP